ncbi:MAG: DUF4252 domain-containing protein [Bacteroidales bacterium]|nr:DUF4252 domain-containing protein [Bacteroidales bacterium]
MQRIKIGLLIFIAGCIATTFGQSHPLDKTILKYKHEPGFYYLTAETNMMCPDSLQDHKDWIINLKLVRIDMEEVINGKLSGFIDDFMNQATKSDYIELMKISSNSGQVQMLARKNEGKISEFVLSANEHKETTLIVATGNFDMMDLLSLSSLKNCKGFNLLNHFCRDK